jgi:ATP-dependent Lon protease
LAAKRAGIQEVILSVENRKDVLEIKQQDIQGLDFHYVSYVEEVIPLALQPAPVEQIKKEDVVKSKKPKQKVKAQK